MSQPNRSTINRNLLNEQLDTFSNNLVRFLINRNLTRQPVKRGDLLKFLNSLKDGLSRNANELIRIAGKKLTEEYGYKVIELNDKTLYILILCEENHNPNVVNLHSESHSLLIAALAHIFMNGGSVKEDAMWRFLEKAGLIKDGDATAKKILTHKFTKELYLNFIKEGELDNPKFVFKWGPRATEEMPKLIFLKKIAEAFNRDPKYWCEQYEEALQGEENIP